MLNCVQENGLLSEIWRASTEKDFSRASMNEDDLNRANQRTVLVSKNHMTDHIPVQPYTMLARTYLRTASTLQGLQTLDPFTDMYTYTGMCLAHPLDIVNTF